MVRDYPAGKLEENPEMFVVFYEAMCHAPVPGKREGEKDPLDWVYRNPRKS